MVNAVFLLYRLGIDMYFVERFELFLHHHHRGKSGDIAYA